MFFVSQLGFRKGNVGVNIRRAKVQSLGFSNAGMRIWVKIEEFMHNHCERVFIMFFMLEIDLICGNDGWLCSIAGAGCLFTFTYKAGKFVENTALIYIHIYVCKYLYV